MDHADVVDSDNFDQGLAALGVGDCLVPEGVGVEIS